MQSQSTKSIKNCQKYALLDFSYYKDTNGKIRTTFSIEYCRMVLVPTLMPGAHSAFLRLSQPFTCVYAAGTKFGANQTSTGVYELGLSYLSISIFRLLYHHLKNYLSICSFIQLTYF